MSIPSSAFSATRRDADYESSPKLKLLSANHSHEMYESTHETTVSLTTTIQELF